MIEVSGVLISWDTFVIRSVFSLSFLMASSTALLSPLPILLIFSAMSRSSPRSHFRSIRYSRLPPDISSIPFLILLFATAPHITAHMTATSTATASTRNGTSLKMIASHWININPSTAAALFTVIARDFHTLPAAVINAQSRLPFQRIFALILRIRLT